MQRLLAMATAASLGLGACTGAVAPTHKRVMSDVTASPRKPAVVATVNVALPQLPASPSEPVASALNDPAAPGLPKPLVDPAEILSGGPPPDGIPAIDHPRFDRADAVDWLSAKEAVVALSIGDDVRAYPVQVLIWHEIVNDTVGGVPVAVTYCPLCNTAVAFDRRVGDRTLDFGTSGKLYNSNLVAYDRQTHSLWVQFSGQAVAGTLTGTTLAKYPLQTVSWADWKVAHPIGWVLDRHTGYDRPYGDNPYPGYDDITSEPFLFSGKSDPRLPAMARVLGLQSGGSSLAIALGTLQIHHVMEVEVGNVPVVVWQVPGTASALSSSRVAAGKDVGATGAFSPVVGTRLLHFSPSGRQFLDIETGSTWNVLGRAVAGTLQGQQLVPLHHVDTFWFVWATFLPDTKLIH